MSLNITVLQSKEWIAVNEALGGFEDGIIREVSFQSGRWLNQDDRLEEHGFAHVTIIVQLQSGNPRAARLSFRGVTSLAIDENTDVAPAEGIDLAHGWECRFLSCRIRATSCDVQDLTDDWLGQGPFLRAASNE